MAYSSITSILSIVPMLPQTTTDAGYSITVATINRHITRADAKINSIISKQYAVPLSPTPPLIASIAEDIATYYTCRSFFTQDNYNKLDSMFEFMTDALKDLGQIALGNINLVDTSGSQIPKVGDVGESFVDSTTIDAQSFFDIDSEYNWKFNDDLVDNIER